jgi:hypothetical protein
VQHKVFCELSACLPTMPTLNKLLVAQCACSNCCAEMLLGLPQRMMSATICCCMWYLIVSPVLPICGAMTSRKDFANLAEQARF